MPQTEMQITTLSSLNVQYQLNEEKKKLKKHKRKYTTTVHV